jgi:DNA-binding XRE family transcriptional regulator
MGDKTSVPQAHEMLGIIDFLGYMPYSIPQSFGGWLAQCRMSQGQTRKELADPLGFDEETIGNWETGRTKVRKTARLVIAQYFGSVPTVL